MKQYFYQSESGGLSMPKPTKVSFDPEFIIIDLFCGAGGTTTGFESALVNGIRVAKVVACVNHDPIAIKSHWENHPEVVHFEEDIRTLDLGPLSALVEAYRVLYPKAKIVLWASLECTNFSKAKGGQPRDADSRTLADHLDRYITAITPDYIQIENVVEFMSWGPLDENGKPLSKKSGSDWLRWRREICQLGYYDEWKELNSADFGAYTSRNRLFGCFAKSGLSINWPAPTHSKKPGVDGMFEASLAKWKPVKDLLDFNDEGKSIFNRKKPLSDKTLERIYAGLVKYVAGGKEAFMLRYNSVSKDGSFKQTATDIDSPCPTVATQNRLGMCFIAKYYSGKQEGKVIPVTGPAGTVTTADGQSLVQAIPFIAKYYGNGANISSVDEPAGTLTTKDRLTKVQPVYILNPSHGGHSTSIEKPCPVIIARQDKAPLYLTSIECFSEINIHLETFLTRDDLDILEQIATNRLNDDQLTIRLKILEFMWMYNIDDIKMRMLKVSELKVIQGFPKDYVLCGTQTDQKKFIGNSVVPHVVKYWCEAMSNLN